MFLCGKGGNWCPGLLKRSVASGLREVVEDPLILHSSGGAVSGALCPVLGSPV